MTQAADMAAPRGGHALDPVAELERIGVVPLAIVESVDDAAPLAAAMLAGGLPCLEVGLRTRASERVLAEIAAAESDVLVGAGTVLSAEQVERVVEAGARFVVTPGFSPSVAAECRTLGVPLVPGVATATEVMAALDAGCRVLKFFPAECIGGVPALAALSAAFLGVRFVPTGGISPDNMGDYLALPAVAAIGGSWITAPKLLAAGNFAAVQERAADAVARVRAHGRPNQEDKG